MAGWGWQSLLTAWDEDERDLLLSSWRKSTLSSYRPAWNRWIEWCAKNNIIVSKPDPTDLARYLANLSSKEGLSYGTICLHRSVISTFCEPYLNYKLSENVIVKHILKAISLQKPKISKRCTWNPIQVISWLQENSVDGDITLYEASRRCATILLLASGRRVHDLTLLDIAPENILDEGSSITLFPLFGSKTDSSSYRQSGWKLHDHPDQRISPVFWIRQVLSLSANRRQSISSLFITCRGDIKAASRTVIGSWIKSILQEAGIDSSPGSTRSAVSSWNWLNNLPIDEILARGNWRSENTFHNYYRRQIITRDNPIQNGSSLTDLFHPA